MMDEDLIFLLQWIVIYRNNFGGFPLSMSTNNLKYLVFIFIFLFVTRLFSMTANDLIISNEYIHI